MISRFFAHDFDHENLSLRISEGGVLPRRTRNPFIQKVKKEKKKEKKKKEKTRAPDVEEKEVEASETTKAEPTPDPKLEARTHENEPRSNREAEGGVPAQECVEGPEQTIEPSEVAGMLEEGVIVEVGLTLFECP